MAAEDVEVQFGPRVLWLRVDGFIDELSRTYWGCEEDGAQGGYEAVALDRCVWTLQRREGAGAGKLLTLSLPLPPASAEEVAYKKGGWLERFLAATPLREAVKGGKSRSRGVCAL